MDRPLVRLPDHLGDRVLALPALHALCATHGPLYFEGRGAWDWLRAELPDCGPPPRGAHPRWALLLKPSASAALGALRARARLGAPGDLRRPLLSTVVAPVGEHRVNAYLRLAAATGAYAQDGARAPALRAPLTEPPVPTDGVPVGAADTLLLVGSATGRVVDWPQLRALADALLSAGRRAIFVPPLAAGAETIALAGPHPLVWGARASPPGVPQVAALARAAGAIVGADSGLSHVCAAARRGAAQRVDAVHVILGSTAAERTAAPGARVLRSAALPCAPCGRKTCAVAARGCPPCLELGVDRVLAALCRALDRGAA